ncbi:MAG: IS110 family transposase [Candidatus Brocadiae bacterium]|nr:IS110 family transposase [Candidatus Brocadiia bacterium]
MRKCIMVGCDLHDDSMLVKFALGRQKPQKRSFRNTRSARGAMIEMLKRMSANAQGAEVVFAYEASSQGFGLYDELSEAGLACHVLAPTKIARSPKHRRSKTDERDAERILELLRAHVLAGCELPRVWIPDKQIRDEREIVRCRLDLVEKRTALKSQSRTLLKRNGIRKPKDIGQGWTNSYRAWLRGLARCDAPLGYGARMALWSLLRQLEAIECEIELLDEQVQMLSLQERYKEPVGQLTKLKGVGVLTAMVFLTEMGDLSRFSNRRQVGAYLGLVPASNETGEGQERKGHITRQGSPRVRKALCQATWSRVRTDKNEQLVYGRICAKNPKHKKIAVVAIMRRLAIRMWHVGREAQRGCAAAPGRGRPRRAQATATAG